uniref:Uncharacterized protein n=1 Tax=Castor canadensis TaxID=51338 RepID=A0A8C0XHJ6_CASCN
ETPQQARVVSWERHGDKAAREEIDSNHAGVEHKITVGSRDEPSVFSPPDTQVSFQLRRMGP